MSTNREPQQRPEVGDLVAVPLPNGSYGLIWVIASKEYAYDRRSGPEPSITLLVMEGFWPGLPGEGEWAAARPAGRRGPAVPGYDDVWKGWFRGAVPSDFAVVGQRAPSDTEFRQVANISGTMVFGTGERLRAELWTTWRLEHDRAALTAEWAAERAERDRRAALRRRTRTLPKMLREKVFPEWDGHRPGAVVREARRIFRDATRELIALGGSAAPDEHAAVLRRIVTEFNALDDRTGCVETVEREQIVARVEELAALVGLTNDDEALTGHRDW